MIVDLHTHSTASDGQYTPSQLVRLAVMPRPFSRRKSRIRYFLSSRPSLIRAQSAPRPGAPVRGGYTATVKEAFDRYLDTDEYQRIERAKPDARTCIEAIRAAGGMASLAHPYQLNLEEEGLDV